MERMGALAEAGQSRRDLFRRARLSLSAALLPPNAMTAGQSAPGPVSTVRAPLTPVMAKLSAYMSEARSRALPDEVVEKAKQHILDTLAAMVSGSQLLPGRDAVRFARAYGGKQIATVVASDVVCGPIEAALTNGMLGHSDETDDYAPSGPHPGCAVVPAALALGEQFGVDGGQFIRAVTLGYDVAPRITLALGGPGFMSKGRTRAHRPMAAIFGAAAAAGCVAGLSAQQMRWLLDYTAQQASGLPSWRRDTQHVEKAFVFGGMNAR
ncbi:MAG: MmgE/PrpD family protein, partial [Terriglobia bacterium]